MEAWYTRKICALVMLGGNPFGGVNLYGRSQGPLVRDVIAADPLSWKQRPNNAARSLGWPKEASSAAAAVRFRDA